VTCEDAVQPTRGRSAANVSTAWFIGCRSFSTAHANYSTRRL